MRALPWSGGAAWVKRVALCHAAPMEPTAREHDALAAEYAGHVSGELAHKPMDRAWLQGFARNTAGRGLVADLGCGPGHVAAFLTAEGAETLGLDLSPGLIAQARAAHPTLAWEVGDLRAPGTRPGRFAGAIAMHALIHLENEDLAAALRACRQALLPGGEFRAAVHLGDGVLRPDTLRGVPVSLGFRLFGEGALDDALREAGFTVTESLVREPYPEVEYRSRRAYVTARA